MNGYQIVSESLSRDEKHRFKEWRKIPPAQKLLLYQQSIRVQIRYIKYIQKNGEHPVHGYQYSPAQIKAESIKVKATINKYKEYIIRLKQGDKKVPPADTFQASPMKPDIRTRLMKRF